MPPSSADSSRSSRRSAQSEASRSLSAPLAQSSPNPAGHMRDHAAAPGCGPPGSSQSGLSRSSTIHYDTSPFSFHAKTSFDARQDLQVFRSDSFVVPPPAVDDDIWKRSAPDFRPQGYAPRPPKRNSRDAVQPWKYGSGAAESKSAEPAAASKLYSFDDGRESDDVEFQRHFHVLDPQEARIQFVKEGVYHPGPYKMPKHHDFRQYPPIASLDLPEFETNYEKDPYNINFHTKRLPILKDAIYGKAPTERDIRGRQMAPPLIQPPKWEARLILPKTHWPEAYNCYTRYRRTGRTAHSALMDRIEDTVTAQWAKEKLDKLILEKQKEKERKQDKEQQQSVEKQSRNESTQQAREATVIKSRGT